MIGLACQTLFLCGDHYVRTLNTEWIVFAIKLSFLFNGGLYFFSVLSPLSLLGNAITVFNVVLFGVPLTKIGIILRTRNASSIPQMMTFIAVINNAVWSLYALLIEDSVLLLPSLLGYFLSSFQVLLIFWCKGALPFDLDFLLLLVPSR